VAGLSAPARPSLYERLGIPTVASVQRTADSVLRRMLPPDASLIWSHPTGAVSLVNATPSPASRFTIADAIDPKTPWDVQAEIARMRPDLWAHLSKNPSLYPDLRAWLDRHITNE